jgi:hypothetical protein
LYHGIAGGQKSLRLCSVVWRAGLLLVIGERDVSSHLLITFWGLVLPWGSVAQARQPAYASHPTARRLQREDMALAQSEVALGDEPKGLGGQDPLLRQRLQDLAQALDLRLGVLGSKTVKRPGMRFIVLKIL